LNVKQSNVIYSMVSWSEGYFKTLQAVILSY
jgi:hypothetical protein